MKTVIVALLVVLVVSHSEALRCNCGGRTNCPSSGTQTCSGSNKVCINFRFTNTDLGYFRSCYSAFDCSRLCTARRGGRLSSLVNLVTPPQAAIFACSHWKTDP
ncbi:hypothetical protein JOB18_035596 [Solea senegalensis]|uniref:Uncharacterized protein n=1 Tax=Solea senegalensis TaxID=28829 RepID=A0AAV6RPY9_SOLSE|nr:hypothetical protein JOB18_035596 [Solea senegalensis]